MKQFYERKTRGNENISWTPFVNQSLKFPKIWKSTAIQDDGFHLDTHDHGFLKIQFLINWFFYEKKEGFLYVVQKYAEALMSWIMSWIFFLLKNLEKYSDQPDDSFPLRYTFKDFYKLSFKKKEFFIPCLQMKKGNYKLNHLWTCAMKEYIIKPNRLCCIFFIFIHFMNYQRN